MQRMGVKRGLFQPHLGRGNSLETTELGEVERPEDMIEISLFFFFSFAPEDPLTQAFFVRGLREQAAYLS